MNKTIKYLATIVLIIISNVHFLYCQEDYKMYIKYVDFDILTLFDVQCDEFESYFRDDIETLIVDNDSIIIDFLSSIDTLSIDSLNYFPDVRLKIEIIRNDSITNSFCMSKLGMVNNGVPLVYSREILYQIDEIIISETLNFDE